MSLSLQNLFGYTLDNWMFCLAILATSLSFYKPRERAIMLSVTLCIGIGHYASPYVFAMKDSWKFWILFAVLVDFLKLSLLLALVYKNKHYRCRLLEVLCIVFLMLIGVHILKHIDWIIIRTNYLEIQLFSISLKGEPIIYNTYKLAIQALNIVTIMLFFSTWIKNLITEEHDAVLKSGDNDYNFHARNAGI